MASKFWAWVDRNGVSPLWIVMYYSPLLIFCLLASITLPLIHAHLILSGIPLLLWFWVQTLATTSAMIGLLLRQGDTPASEMRSWRLKRDWYGLGLQMFSHGIMSAMLAEFQVAVIKFLSTGVLGMTSLVWWLLAYGAAAITPYVFGTFMLSLQCFHKIERGRKLQAAVP